MFCENKSLKKYERSRVGSYDFLSGAKRLHERGASKKRPALASLNMATCAKFIALCAAHLRSSRGEQNENELSLHSGEDVKYLLNRLTHSEAIAFAQSSRFFLIEIIDPQ